MTTQAKLIRKKQRIRELADFLKNILVACRLNGGSRHHFYDIKRAYEEHVMEELKEKSRRKPCIKNRVAPEVEEAVLQVALEYPAYRQTRVSNEETVAKPPAYAPDNSLGYIACSWEAAMQRKKGKESKSFHTMRCALAK